MHETHLIGLRTAVIGVGRMGMRHLEAVNRLGMTICGIADQSADNLATARKTFALAEETCFQDGMAMLEAVRPDAVVVATTAPVHAMFTMASVEAGARYLLCEKPFASSIVQCRSMMRLTADRGVVLAVNHQMRFMPQYTEVKALIGGDELGPLSSILVAGSNFGLAMNASHYFEMFRFITGRTIDSIQAWFDEERVPNPRGQQFDDRAGRLLCRTDGGPSLYIDFASTSGYGLQVVYICKYGQIIVDELNGSMQITARREEFRALPTTRYGMPADSRAVQIPPADTIEPTVAVWRAMASGSDYPDGAVGLHAVRCLVGAHASHAGGGRSVRLDSGELSEETVFPWA